MQSATERMIARGATLFGPSPSQERDPGKANGLPTDDSDPPGNDSGDLHPGSDKSTPTHSVEDAEVESDTPVFKKPKFWLLFGATVVSGVANGVTFAQMGRAMSDITFAPWLLYATALPYSILYLGVILVRKGGWEIVRDTRLWKYYLILGVFGVGLPSIAAQFGDVYVSPTLQALLQAMQIPFTALGVKCILTARFGLDKAGEPTSWMMWLACAIVMCAIFIAVLPSTLLADSSNIDAETTAWGFAAFMFSMMGAALVDVVQRAYFVVEKGDNVAQLFWSNAITVVLFLLTPLLSMTPSFGALSWSDMLSRQADAFVCFAQASDPLPDGCTKNATWWTTAFVFAYSAYFYMQARLVREYGPIFQSVILGAVVACQTVAQTIPAFGGLHLHPLHLVAVGIALCGILFYAYGRAKLHKPADKDVEQFFGEPLIPSVA